MSTNIHIWHRDVVEGHLNQLGKQQRAEFFALDLEEAANALRDTYQLQNAPLFDRRKLIDAVQVAREKWLLALVKLANNPEPAPYRDLPRVSRRDELMQKVVIELREAQENLFMAAELLKTGGANQTAQICSESAKRIVALLGALDAEGLIRG